MREAALIKAMCMEMINFLQRKGLTVADGDQGTGDGA
jgi:hypothetical protein